MKNLFGRSLVVALSCALATSLWAAVNPGFPKINYSNVNTNSVQYSAGAGVFSLSTSPTTVLFARGEGPRLITGTKSLALRITVNSDGALVGGVAGDDLALSGTVSRVGGPTYTGVLLTGEIKSFASVASGPVAYYDLVFQPTGGAMSALFSGGDIAIQVTSENSTFTGNFSVDFNGASKGALGLYDIIPPSIVVPPDMVVECHAFNNGLPGAFVSYPPPTVTDSCDPNPTITCAPASGAFFALAGTGMTAVHTVTCTAQDSSGNTSTSTFQITVQDTLPPEWADPSNPVIISDLTHPIALVNEPGAGYVTYTFPDPFALDNSFAGSFPTSASAVDQNGATIELTKLANGDLQGRFPINTNNAQSIVTITADDGRGNTTQHQAGISVRDNENPTITPPADQTYPYTGNPIHFEEPVAADNAPGVVVSCVPANQTLVDPGAYTIDCTATDSSGNTAQCAFTVTIQAQPSLISPADIIVATDPGQATAVVNYPMPTPGLNSPPLTISCVPSSGSTFPKGATTVTCTGTDSDGNSATCTFTITVVDTEIPTIAAPAHVVVSTDPGQNHASGVSLGAPVTADNCGVASVANNAPAVFPKGVTTITWTVTDTSGNQTAAAQTVTVNDTEIPTIAAPAHVVVSTDPGQNQASGVSLGTPVTADNCGVASVANNAPAVFPKGVTTVTWTVTDTSGNQAAAVQTVTVNDTEPPVITCPADVKVLVNSLCADGSSVTFTAPAATDNCGAVQVVCSPSSGSFFDMGATLVTCTATDGSGNQAQCSFTVTVEQAPRDPILASVECSRIKFDRNGNSEFAWFRGQATLTGGDQSSDFRAETSARGALKVTIGNTVVYCQDDIPFRVVDQGACNNTEKWTFHASPLEETIYRFKDDQHYVANRDRNLPASAATGFKNVGNLKTVFIGSDETRFRYAFKNASKPITIVVDGIVLLSVNAQNVVSSTFPHWVCGKTVEVLFPDRLAPGNTIAWHATSNPASVSSANLIYAHSASANGNATDTYFNEGGRFWFKVPVTGLTQATTDRSVKVEFTIGQPGSTKVAGGSFVVSPHRKVGCSWKFGQCSDDSDEDEQEDDQD